MPSFECIKSKAVNVTKKYLGEGLNFQDTIVTDLEIFFADGDNDLSDWKDYITTYQNAGQRTASLTIGTITFTNASILKFEATSSPDPMDNGLRGVIKLQIEEVVLGDISNINSTEFNDIFTQINSYSTYIQEIAESFDYSVGLNDQYRINHSVTVVPNDTATSSSAGNPTALTGAIAQAIVDNYRSSSSNASSIHSTLRNAGIGGFITTSENSITGEYTYSRRIDTYAQNNSSNKTTEQYTHNVALGQNGVISVTESGTIKSLEKTTSFIGSTSNGITQLTTALADSVSRCSTVYSNACTKFGQSGAGLETANPVSTQKNINHITQEITYSITYSDDPSIGSNYSTDIELNISQDQNGITEGRERATFTIYGSKGNLSTTPQSIYSTESSGAIGRINSLLSSSGLNTNTSLVAKTSEVSYNPNGKTLSYTKTFTTDITRNYAGVGIKTLTKVVTDKEPLRIKSEFPIAGLKMLVHDPGNATATGGGRQTSMGERTVTVTCVLDRSDLGAGFLSNPSNPTNAISHASSEVETKLKNVFADLNLTSDKLVLTDVSYKLDSKRNLTVTATAQYPQEI